MSVFTKPSEARASEEADLLRRGELFDWMGRRRIIHPDHVGKPNPKLVSYTRATSYIGALEEVSGLEKWRTRLTLEGASEARLEEEVLIALQMRLHGEGEVQALANTGNLKGLSKTKLLEIADEPRRTYNKRLAEIADHAFQLAGGRESAEYGTAHHGLMERWFAGTLTSEYMAETEEAWPGILHDFAGFRDEWGAFERLTGARVIHMEALVVNDKLGVAGRTDLIVRCQLPGDERSRLIIVDLKTGSIDGELKLSQQLAMYAGSKHYDPETGTRANLRVRQDVGIVIHAPKGEGVAKFRLVQLAPGRSANALCAKVRASRRKIPGLVTPLPLDLVES